MTVNQLITKYNTLLNENKILREELESIEEDGTVEHNNAIELRQKWLAAEATAAAYKEDSETMAAAVNAHKDENVKLVEKIKKLEDENLENQNGNKNWMNLYQEVVDKNRELLKNNNRLTVDYNALLNKGGLKYMEAKFQAVQNDCDKYSKERDEYKHQLNAANKEIEALKKEKKESFEILKKTIEDESDRSDKLASTYTNTWINLETANKEIDKLNRLIGEYKKVLDRMEAEKGKLKQDIYDEYKHYIDGLNRRIDELKAANEEIDKLTKEGLEKKQKHPMYPIHWGGWDGAASAHPEEYKKWLNEQKDKAVAESLPDDLETRVKRLEKVVEELKIIKN
jgi:chromosome segregation ATPase